MVTARRWTVWAALLVGAALLPAPLLAQGLDAPTNLRFTLNSPTSATVSWDAVGGPDDGVVYALTRNQASIGATRRTQRLDNGLLPGRRFVYTVTATNAAGARSTPASVTLVTQSAGRPASESAGAASASATGTSSTAAQGPSVPRDARLEIYSDTAAELFWARAANERGLSVEIHRDGRRIGSTSGTSYFDDTRTGRDHAYTLYARNAGGVRSAGVRLGEGQTPTASPSPAAPTGGATPLATVRPNVARLPARGEGTDVFLLNGQSNANPQFLAALTDRLNELGADFVTGHYYGGGIPISSWIAENGTKGYRWPIMMSVFDGVTAACESDPDSIRSITLVYYQGEADVNTTETVISATNGEESPYARKLRAFVREFGRHFERRCGITPNVSLAMISFIESHPLFPARLREPHALIRREIRDVAREFPRAGAFDTLDLAHADHVHLSLYPASDAQATAAKRAIELFFEP